MTLVSYLDRIRSTYWGEELEGEVQISLISTRKIPKTFIDNIRFSPDLDNILQKDDIFPWLQIQLWRLYWYLNEPNSVNLARFHQDIQTIYQVGNLPEPFWHHAFRTSWPSLDLFVRQKVESMEKLLPYLEMDKQSLVKDQIRYAIEKYLEASDSSSSERLVTALRTGLELDTIFPEVATIAEQMGVNLQDLINVYCRISPASSRRQTLTAQTVDALLIRIEESKDDIGQLNRIIMFLTNSTWTPTPSNLAQAKRSLETLLIYWEMSNDASILRPSLMLALQILVYDDICLDIMPRMFYALAQTQADKSHYGAIRNTLDELTSDSLAKLQSFLMHKDENIQVGALIFWKNVVDVTFLRRGLRNEFKEIKKIRFDPLIGLSLAQNNNEERSLGGIALLTLSDYPVQDQEYRQILLTLIQESTNTSKDNAWVRFLREAPIQDTSWSSWHDVLQNILDEPGYYSRSILNAAMERYQKLSHKRIEATFYL